MPFDVNAAVKAGYSPAEIADYLGKQNGFDTQGALKSGYSPDEIIGHLNPSGAGSGRGASADPRRLDTPTGIVQAAQARASSNTDAPENAVAGADDAWGSITSAGDQPKRESVLQDTTAAPLPGMDVDPNANRAARDKSVSPDSVMFNRSNVDDAFKSATAQSAKPSDPNFARTGSGGTVADIAANALAGPAKVVLGQAETLGSALGMDDAAAKVRDTEDDVQNWQNRYGGTEVVGKVADATSSILYSMLASRGAGPLKEAAVNAGMFAIPAFRKTYDANIAQGKDESTALSQALLSGTFNMAMPGLASKSGQVIGKFLGTEGMGVLGKTIAETTSGGTVFAGLGAANQGVSQAIDVANGYTPPKFDSQQPAVDFITGALLHAAPHVTGVVGKSVDAGIGAVAPQMQAARELSRSMDSAELAPQSIGPAELNPNIARARNVDEAIQAFQTSVPDVAVPKAIPKVADGLSAIRPLKETNGNSPDVRPIRADTDGSRSADSSAGLEVGARIDDAGVRAVEPGRGSAEPESMAVPLDVKPDAIKPVEKVPQVADVSTDQPQADGKPAADTQLGAVDHQAIADQFEQLYQQDVKADIRRRLGLEAPEPVEKKSKQSPFRTFLREYGIQPSLAADITGARGLKANNALPATFRKNGLNLDALAERAVERGFLKSSDLSDENDNGGTNKLVEMIKAEIRGQRQATVEGSQESAETDHQRVQRLELESEADRLGLPYDGAISSDRLASMVSRVHRALDQAKAEKGTLKGDRVLRNARETVARIERKRAQYEQENADFAKANQAEQDALLEVLHGDDGTPTVVRGSDLNAEDAWRETLGKWNDENGQTHTPEYSAARQDQTPSAGKPEEGGSNASSDGAQAQQRSAEIPVRAGDGQGEESNLTDADALQLPFGEQPNGLSDKPAGTWVLVKSGEGQYQVDYATGNGRWTGGAVQPEPGKAFGSALAQWKLRGGKDSEFKRVDKSEFVSGRQENLLTAPTREDVLAQQERADAGEKAKAKADTESANKAKADAERNEFTLTGSDRPADVAAAGGQSDIFADPVAATKATLDANKVTGKERLDVIRDVKSGALTPEEVKEAYPDKAKIEDFGEKITGARKDYAEKLKDAEDLDVATEPLSKTWPEPDYKKLLEGGTSPWAAAFVHAARDMIPAKPKQSWKLKRYVEQVKMLRDMASRILSGELDGNRVLMKLQSPEYSRLYDSIGSGIELYQLVGHEKSLKGMEISRGEYTMFKGVQYDPPKIMWTVGERGHPFGRDTVTGDTKADALQAFKAKYDAMGAAPKKSTEFIIWSKAGKYHVGKQIGRDYVDLAKPFDNIKDARQYKADHQAELEAKLERYKTAPFERNAENQPRIGEDHRNGASVTPEGFTDAFGFRGVQFGNYVEGTRRQLDLNNAYDGLSDLAAILNIPTRALSLDGQLGLAFGARGRGGKNPAAAHYEPDQVVINLTKNNGAGSLAHEWFHSLDNYFAKLEGGGNGYVTAGATNAAIRPEMVHAFKNLMLAIRASDMRTRSRELDKRRNQPYWSTNEEMAARAFESYVINKLHDQSASNDYLANVVGEDYWKAQDALMGHEGSDSYPYPRQSEMATIGAAFDHFFSTIKTKETDKGVAMFARGDSDTAKVRSLGDQWVVFRKLATGGEAHEGYYSTESDANRAAERINAKRQLDVNTRSGKFADWWALDSGNSDIRPESVRGNDAVARGRAIRQTLDSRVRAVKSTAEGRSLQQIESRAGFCFKCAAEAASQGIGDFVIGRSSDGTSPIWHAVVMRDGMVYDPTFGKWFAPGVYEKLGFKEALRLTPQQVRDYIKSTNGVFPDAKNQGLGQSPTGSAAARGLGPEAFGRKVAQRPTGMAVGDAQKVVDTVAGKWENGPRIKVVATPKDLPIDAPHDARGLIHNDTAYVVASNHLDANGVARTLAHEAIGHYGLWKALGSEGTRQFESNLQLALKGGNKTLRELRDQVRQAYVDGDGNYMLTPREESNEIAALAVEHAVDPVTGEFRTGFGFFKQVWAKLAEFLRSKGINVKFSNAELQGILVSSMKGLEAGRRLDGGSHALVTASALGGRADIADSRTGVSSALLELGRHDSLYQYPRSDALNLEDIAQDKGGLIEVSDVDKNSDNNKLWMLSNTTPHDNPAEGVKSWILKLKGVDKYATLTKRGDEVHINVSGVGENNGGSAIYDLAANYALNNGLRFIGDPLGVSNAAMRRRLENMLSSAVKYGTTDHLAPHPDQFIGNEELGIPPLDWTKGDTLGNIRHMVDVSMAATDFLKPGHSDDIRFDPATGTFTDQVGNRLDKVSLAGIYTDRGREAGIGAPGRTTLQRNALFHSLVQSEGARRQLLVHLHSLPGGSGEGLSGELQKSFYARGGVDRDELSDSADQTRELPGESMLGHATTRLSDLIDSSLKSSGIYDAVAPMSSGTQQTRAIAQAHINAERVARYQWQRIDDYVTKNFTPEQRKRMWEAADEQNTLMQTGSDTTGRGLDQLSPDERAAVDQLHGYGEELLQRAKDVGMFKGEGLPYWTPRMMAMIDEHGEYQRPSEGKVASSAGEGRNITTNSANLRQRKYLTVEETEAAMNAKGGELVRDIRTMPLALEKLERAIAGRELVNQIRALGRSTGSELVSDSAKPGFFTMDHPAFQTFKPRFDEIDGKYQAVRDQSGNIVFDKTPIFISKDFEGPLKAIMSTQSGKIYTGYMLLKSKAMSAIMFSPLIHNQVIFGRALAYGGIKTPAYYFTGHAAKQDTDFMQKMIGHGLVPIGAHNSMLDVGDIARGFGKEGSWGDPEESWVGLGAKKLGNAVKPGLGDTIKSGIDYAGDIWHNKLLWNRVGDLQAGIAKDVYTKLRAKGVDDNAASTVAAHIANRYAGAIGRENMSAAAHKLANVLLFSKSFNAGNIGQVKDALYGLPAGLKAQLLEGSTSKSSSQGMDFATRKARTGLIIDLAATVLITSMVQDWMKRNKSKGALEQLSEGLSGYEKRAADMWANAKDNPLTLNSYNPYRLSSTWTNEPGKQDRVDLGAQPNGRHEYMRLPTGKVIEDLHGWIFHPGDTLDKKLSPMAKFLAAWKANNKDGFGTPVYDPSESTIKNAMDVAKFLLASNVPVDQIGTAVDAAKGRATDLDKDKLLGNFTGLSVSQGHPGGPEAGVAAKTEERIQASRKFVMEKVKSDLKAGDEDAARARLEDIGLKPREISLLIRNLTNPRTGLSPAMRRKFNQHATDEEQGTMDSVGQ